MPRDKKTSPKELEELPILNKEESALIEAWAAGLDQTACYRAAYGAEGYSLPALYVAACRKFADPKINAHMRALRAVGLAKASLSLHERIEAEQAFAQRAEDDGNYGAAGQAHDRVNKLLGLYVEKFEDTSQDPLKLLEEIARVSPDLASKLAADSNIAWGPKLVAEN